jgi:hypothetical protein
MSWSDPSWKTAARDYVGEVAAEQPAASAAFSTT